MSQEKLLFLSNLSIPEPITLVGRVGEALGIWFSDLSLGYMLNFAEVLRFGSPPWSLLWTGEERRHRSPQIGRGRAKGSVCWSLSVLLDSAIPWTVAHQAPLSMRILQAILLEWVAMPSSRGSSQPRDQTQSPTLQADSLLTEPPGQMNGGI